MAPGVTTALWCFGIAMFLIVAGRIADWSGRVYLTTTTLWYLMSAALIVLSIGILLYHASGVKVTTA